MRGERLPERRGKQSIAALDAMLRTQPDALQASSTPGIVGGGIYDAMLARCANKARAETIL
jgi:hypothetical protein